jgi:hypothetical protein
VHTCLGPSLRKEKSALEEGSSATRTGPRGCQVVSDKEPNEGNWEEPPVDMQRRLAWRNRDQREEPRSGGDVLADSQSAQSAPTRG